jgi:hypothetical protein
VAGDDVSVGMRVGPGVRLDVVEPARPWRSTCRAVRPDGGLCRGRRRGRAGLAGEPFVVATGAVVDREARGPLHGSGAAALREVLVLRRVRGPVAWCGSGFAPARRGRRGPPLDGARPQVAVVGGHRVVDSTFSGDGRTSTPAPRTGSSRGRGDGREHLGRDASRRWSPSGRSSPPSSRRAGPGDRRGT